MNKKKLAKQVINGSTDQMLYGDRRLEAAADIFAKTHGIEPDDEIRDTVAQAMNVGYEIYKTPCMMVGAGMALFGVWAYNKLTEKSKKKNDKVVETKKGSSES